MKRNRWHELGMLSPEEEQEIKKRHEKEDRIAIAALVLVAVLIGIICFLLFDKEDGVTYTIILAIIGGFAVRSIFKALK